MRHTIFDPEAAAAARRSWELATPAQQEEMLKPERIAYGEERARRAILATYITNIKDNLDGRAVRADSLMATAAVVRAADVLGAISSGSSTGRPRVLVDNNAVTYYAEQWRYRPQHRILAGTTLDGQLTPDPVIDPLLELLADALGLAWTWIGDEAIELVELGR